MSYLEFSVVAFRIHVSLLFDHVDIHTIRGSEWYCGGGSSRSPNTSLSVSSSLILPPRGTGNWHPLWIFAMIVDRSSSRRNARIEIFLLLTQDGLRDLTQKTFARSIVSFVHTKFNSILLIFWSMMQGGE
jgi:hypothetical protein